MINRHVIPNMGFQMKIPQVAIAYDVKAFGRANIAIFLVADLLEMELLQMEAAQVVLDHSQVLFAMSVLPLYR